MIYDVVTNLFEASLRLSLVGLFGVGFSFLALIAVKFYDMVGPPHWRNNLPRAFLPESKQPHVLVQIPVFNEHEIALGAIQAAVALDWPRDKLTIQILDDSTDESVEMIANAAAHYRSFGFNIEHRHRTDRSGFKAGALSEGLAATHQPFIAMLDVDFRPPPHWLRDIIPILLADPTAAFVQSRCEFANYKANWLTRVQGLMLDAHFVIEQAARYRAGWLFQFNGTGGIWRREAIDDSGGWSSDSIVEDLDLTVRAALRGWRALFVMEPGIPGLVPEKISHWRVQQRRWSTGFVEVARKLLKKIWGSDWAFSFKLSTSILIFVQAFYPCAAVATISAVALILLHQGHIGHYIPMLIIVTSFISIVAVGMTLLPFIALKRGPIWRYFATLALLPPSMVFISLSNAPSILRTIVGRRESFKRTPKSEKAQLEAPPRD